jgi:hypothetical protein
LKILAIFTVFAGLFFISAISAVYKNYKNYRIFLAKKRLAKIWKLLLDWLAVLSKKKSSFSKSKTARSSCKIAILATLKQNYNVF